MIADAYQRSRISTLRPLMQFIATHPRKEEAKAIAASRAGFSKGRMEALYLTWRRLGDDALVKKSKLPKGRKAAADCLQISPEERDKLRQLVIKCDSILLAIEELADWEDCSDELRTLINTRRARRNYPKALRQAARITDHDRDLARGPKRFGLRAYTQLRDLSYIDAAGQEHGMIGGDLFECDDMSVNQLFWYEWPYGGDPLSNMFGVRLGRQMLACRDVARGKWLGFDLIGRVRDAYRAEDVVRFLGRIGETHGLPRLGFRLEHGVWAARSIRGVKDTNDNAEKKVLGSVRDLVDIHYATTAKGKGALEGSFDFLQSLLSFEGIQIGRVRGEYEKTTSIALKCAQGRQHPADAGFLHISELAERINRAMDRADNRPKMGRLIQGVSQEMWNADMDAAPLFTVPENKRHLFLPVKQIRRIEGGHVRYKVPHYSHLFSFRVPEHLAKLGNGYRLLVCFDPSDPHAGALCFDAEVDGRRDFHSAPEQAYGIFPFSPNAPQIDLTKSNGYEEKKAYLAAARTHFRATGMRQGTGASIDQVSDGHGSSTRIARGVEVARPENIPAGDNRAAAALHARHKHIAGDPRLVRARAAAEESARLARTIGADAADDMLDDALPAFSSPSSSPVREPEEIPW
jgi:hypothetical protein